ncbi:MAG: GDP-mannose 4,6-dehydratase, partial [Pseudomonadota bacterium]
LKGEPIDVFGHGDMGRDFTYIDDIVDGVIAALDRPPGEKDGHHNVYNLGGDHPEALMTLIETLEQALGIEANKKMRGMQSGDVKRTWADISKAKRDLGFEAKTPLKQGIANFVAWRKNLPKDVY